MCVPQCVLWRAEFWGKGGADLRPALHCAGMWTSAAVRTFVTQYAAGNRPERVRRYHVKFVGMVLPGDKLETKLQHVAMKNGRLVIKVQTSNASTGELVLDGMAEVVQNQLAYMFTGQGSQTQGMGMDLYEMSPAARQV